MNDIETFLSEVEGRKPLVCVAERGGRFEVILDFEDRHDARVHHSFGVRQWADDACERMNTNARGDIPRLLQIVRAMRAEKQAVIDGMTRAITAEGKANEAFYAMQAERDKLESEYIRCLRDASEVLANLHNVESERDALRERAGKLEKALGEALDGWEYAAQYKGEFLAAKHGDASDIAALRKLLKGSDNGTTETK